MNYNVQIMEYHVEKVTVPLHQSDFPDPLIRMLNRVADQGFTLIHTQYLDKPDTDVWVYTFQRPTTRTHKIPYVTLPARTHEKGIL